MAAGHSLQVVGVLDLLIGEREDPLGFLLDGFGFLCHRLIQDVAFFRHQCRIEVLFVQDEGLHGRDVHTYIAGQFGCT